VNKQKKPLARNPPVKSPQAASIIEAWRRHQEARDRLVGMDMDSPLSRAEIRRLEEQRHEARVKFDDLIEKAWADKQFRPVMAAVRSTAKQGTQSGKLNQYFTTEVMGAATSAHHNYYWPGETENHDKISNRTVIFGIPIVRSGTGELDLGDYRLIKMIRKMGWTPDNSNVSCVGMMTASEAFAFSQKPAAIWSLAEALNRTQAISLESEAESFMGLSKKDREALALGSEMVSGYVLIISAFFHAPDHCAAVDFTEEGPLGQMKKKWQKVCRREFEGLTIGTPQPLANAAFEAIAQQLLVSVQHTHDAGFPQSRSACTEITFVLDSPEQYIDMIGKFSDGLVVNIQNALPPAATWLLAEIVDRVEEVVPASFSMIGAPILWNDGEVLEPSCLPIKDAMTILPLPRKMKR
jgi:hypothetical protein